MITNNTAEIRALYVNYEDMGSPTVRQILALCEEVDALRKKLDANTSRREQMIIPIGLLVLLFIAWKVRKLA